MIGRLPFLSILIFAFFISLNCLSKDNPGELEKMLDKEGDIFKLKSDEFITNPRKIFFKWNSNAKETARAPGYSNTPEMTFFGLKVWECLVRFKDGKFNSMDLYLYDRGDAGSLNNGQFFGILKSLKANLDEWTGSEEKKLPKKKINRKILYSRLWVKKPYSFLLTYSYTGKRRSFKGEFIKLDISNDSDKDNGNSSDSGAPKVVNKDNLVENIKKKDDGSVFIDGIPMVDQGQKGYCAVATTERILRYYGLDVDQHQIAQLAESSAKKGTNREQMLKALKKAGTKFRIKVKKLYENDMFDSLNSLKKFSKRYNKFAKKADLPKIDPENFIAGRTFDLPSFLGKMDYESLKKMKVEKEKRDFQHFKENIKKMTDMGIPIVWSIFTGIYKDPNIPQQRVGGHMRLIIGYNDKEGELVYSDSWGAGHEFKKMKYDDAWTITTGMNYFIPRRNHR